HLVGRGWNPLNPAGNFNPQLFADLAAGREVLSPNIGMQTVHHVHADDAAQAFVRAIELRDAAVGQSFHLVSSGALTLRGYAERMAEYFGATGAATVSSVGRVAAALLRAGGRAYPGAHPSFAQLPY